MFANKKKVVLKKEEPHPDSRVASIEKESGISFADVNIHYASSKPKKLNAHAYAYGNDVFLGPGQEKHLKHELGHVVQQRQGIVRPTMQLKGFPVNTDSVLEKNAESLFCKGTINNMSSPVVQRKVIYDDSKDEPNDIFIYTEIAQISSKFGGAVPSSEFTAWCGDENEDTCFLSHGQDGEIEWNGSMLPPSDFARDFIIGKGIKPDTEKPYIIVIWACGAGENETQENPVTHRIEEIPNSSFVAKVAKKLKEANINAEVRGVSGSAHVTFPSGTHYKPKKNIILEIQFNVVRIEHLYRTGFFIVSYKAAYEAKYPNLGMFFGHMKDLYKIEHPAEDISYMAFMDDKKQRMIRAFNELEKDPRCKAYLEEVGADWTTVKTGELE